MKKDKLVEMLYQTEAFKVAPADKPFWYTSGKLGPFYINTHYLYGSGKAAEDLLAKIDATKTEMLNALIENFDISTVLALGNIDVFVCRHCDFVAGGIFLGIAVGSHNNTTSTLFLKLHVYF